MSRGPPDSPPSPRRPDGGDARLGRSVHYIEENAYLPHAEGDYGRIGALSAHGQAALRKFARYAGEMGQG